MPRTTTVTAPPRSSRGSGPALDGDTDDAPTTWMPDSSLWRSVLARDPASPPSCPRITPSSPRAPSLRGAPTDGRGARLADDAAVVAATSALAADPAGWSR